MKMTRSIILLTLVLCTVLIEIVISTDTLTSTVSGGCQVDTSCISSADCPACQKLKCCLAQNSGINGCNPQNNGLVGSNQCCNQAMVNKINCQAGGVGRKKREAFNFQTGGRKKRQAYNFQTTPSAQWPPAINYVIDSSISQQSFITNIQNVLSHIEAQTGFFFTLLSQPPATGPFMNYTIASSCTAFVGASSVDNNPITMTTDCLKEFGQILYFTVQSLGMFHETQRPDRSQYVTINYTNVDPTHTADFAIITSNILVTLGLPYDTVSIQHFPPTQFSINDLRTVNTVNALQQNNIGQGVQLSFQDAQLLNLLYFPNVCKASQLGSPCQNGGYQDPNNCTVCICPDGFSPPSCTQPEVMSVPSGPIAFNPSGCGGILSASLSQNIIMSPGYTSPQYYPEQAACSWHIVAPNGGNIQLQFTGSFGLYMNPSQACYHWVEIRYTGQMSATGCRFCGQKLPTATLVSSGSEVLVIFRSNISGQSTSSERGFQIGYQIVNAPVCAYTVCQNGGTCSNNICTCASGFNGTNCQTVVPPPSGCIPNPCRNNGTCSSSATGTVSCQCASGFSGQYCTTAPCGGCGGTPGFYGMCTVPTIPATTCQVTTYKTYTTGWWFWCETKTEAVTTSVACTWLVCCDNAVGLSGGCAVLGWSNWGLCSAKCGGGTRVKNLWAFTDGAVGTSTTCGIVGTQLENCNTQQCSCGCDEDDDMWNGRPNNNCQTCLPGFTQPAIGNLCIPSSTSTG